MIKIEAIIKPEKANAIGLALEEAGVGGYFLSNISGKGNQKGVEVTTGRGTTKLTRSSVPKTIITTVVDDSQKQKVLDILLDNAKSGDGSDISFNLSSGIPGPLSITLIFVTRG